MATLDIIIPVYNEGESALRFHHSLMKALQNVNYSLRFIYVNDGSKDNTGEVLKQLASSDLRVTYIELSRNFGHQAALSAGMDIASADVMITLDGDGEHPPEIIPEMIRLYENGYDIVQTQRQDQQRAGFLLKTMTARAFYWLISKLGEMTITPGSADFRLMSKRAYMAMRQLPEYHRFYRGLVHWIGFRSVILPYLPSSRIAGKSKYTLRKMLRLARDGMFSFSLVPLRLGLVLGTLFLLLACGEVVYVLAFWFSGNSSRLVPGWSSLMVMITVSSGISMLIIGILGIYTGMIFQEVKRRPVYLIQSQEPALTTGTEHRDLDLAAKHSSLDGDVPTWEQNLQGR